MDIVAIDAQQRDVSAKKSAMTLLRKEGNVPCVLYSKTKVKHLSVSKKSLKSLIYTPAFKLAEITSPDGVDKCILKDAQFDPVSDEILHVDFQILEKGSRVNVEIPVKFKGDSPGVIEGGILYPNLRKIKVKSAPEDLVDIIEMDISNLQLGGAVRVRDIAVPDGIEIMNNPGIPVATVETPRALKSVLDAEAKQEDGLAEGAEREATEGGEAAEGAAPAE